MLSSNGYVIVKFQNIFWWSFFFHSVPSSQSNENQKSSGALKIPKGGCSKLVKVLEYFDLIV